MQYFPDKTRENFNANHEFGVEIRPPIGATNRILSSHWRFTTFLTNY